METQPLFSVIIPVYNVEKYLKTCVDSVLRQTFASYEVILVDDGSTDQSGAICDAYTAREQVRVIHKPNGGLSSARNAGVDAAKGTYLLFLDSDDFWCEDDCLDAFAAALGAQQPDILMYKIGKYYTDGSMVDYYGDYDISEFQDDKAAIFRYMVANHKQLACACNKVVKRALLQETGLAFRVGTIGEDIEWTVKLFEAARTVSAINRMPHMYRQQREGSITASVTEKKIGDLRKIVTDLADRYREDISPFGQAVLAFTAFEYAILLFNLARYHGAVDWTAYQAYTWLLKYAADGKTKLVALCVKLLGLRNTVRLLKLRKGAA